MLHHRDASNRVFRCGVQCGADVARQINQLSARTAQTLTEVGRHADGQGLYLQVDPSGLRRWILRYQLKGKRRDMGLGPFPQVSLAAAREAAQAAREAIRLGVDPIEARKAPQGVPTLGQAAEQLIRDLAPGWRGKSTEAAWRRSFELYAKAIRDKPINTLGPDDVLSVLRPLWSEKAETAGKLRERLERVFDLAHARGWRQGENPARWKGGLAFSLPPRPRLQRGHHKALPYADLPAAMAAFEGRKGVAARALRWTVLTAVREGMTTGARWREVAGDVWTIPGDRMKEGGDFRVPLSVAALEAAGPRGQPDQLIFPGAKLGSALSNASMDKVLDLCGLDVTVHGFRSTFRDWAGDRTDYARELVEEALAHKVGDSTERAYRRSDALEKRRALMADWAAFATRPAGSGGQ